jgi:hypothetical protein
MQCSWVTRVVVDVDGDVQDDVFRRRWNQKLKLKFWELWQPLQKKKKKIHLARFRYHRPFLESHDQACDTSRKQGNRGRVHYSYFSHCSILPSPHSRLSTYLTQDLIHSFSTHPPTPILQARTEEIRGVSLWLPHRLFVQSCW